MYVCASPPGTDWLQRTSIVVTSIASQYTDSVSGKGNVNGSVRLPVRLFQLYLLHRLTFEIDFCCVCMGHYHSSPGWKVKVIGQGQCKNVCYTSIHCGVL